LINISVLYKSGELLSESYIDFITSTHSLYDRYYNDWKLCINSWYGGVEYKDAKYLRAYQVDLNTPSEAINTYVLNEDGSMVSKVKAKVEYGTSSQETNRGQDLLSGSFYLEKLDNTPLYNYVKLIVAEYNSILFRNPPQRVLPNTPEVNEFLNDVDGEGQSVNEFMSLVDMMTTVYGVCHVECYKPVGSDIPKWKIHEPTSVTNWSYKYDIDGNLKLDRLVIRLEDSDLHSVFRYYTPETIETVFAGSDKDYMPPINDPRLEQIDDNTYRIVQENELGYIPVKTIYQSTKIYNNVGATIIQDVAQIQRSIYGDMAEIYSAITYGSHPTLVVDETTDQINDGQVGAEPGSVIRVQAGLTGTPAYVYEFVSPELTAIDSIKGLVDSKIEKLSQIAMLRSEDLIKASRSGEQIEVYDDKLAAQIRRKATNLENSEAKLWKIWFDWTNQTMPEDFSISYNRQYNKKALEHELNEISMAMSVLERYENMYDKDIEAPEYATQELAEAEAQRLGGSGFHSHIEEDGSTVYMPFSTHAQYEAALGYDSDRADEDGFRTEMRNKIRMRLEQLLSATTTSNGF
jgi:hypothetical protein